MIGNYGERDLGEYNEVFVNIAGVMIPYDLG